MKIKGSGNRYYNVNVEDRTCTCKDWTCRRHNFPYDNPNRLCKHLKEAIELYKEVPDRNPYQQAPPVGLLRALDSNNYILRYTLSNSYLLIRILDSESTPPIDQIIRSLGIDDRSMYCGYGPIIVIACNSDNYLFNRMYYSMSRDEYAELSSILLHKNYKLTKEGLIKDKELVKLDLSTEEELNELLELR